MMTASPTQLTLPPAATDSNAIRQIVFLAITETLAEETRQGWSPGSPEQHWDATLAAVQADQQRAPSTSSAQVYALAVAHFNAIRQRRHDDGLQVLLGWLGG